jgi:hypothetical protein
VIFGFAFRLVGVPRCGALVSAKAVIAVAASVKFTRVACLDLRCSGERTEACLSRLLARVV